MVFHAEHLFQRHIFFIHSTIPCTHKKNRTGLLNNIITIKWKKNGTIRIGRSGNHINRFLLQESPERSSIYHIKWIIYMSSKSSWPYINYYSLCRAQSSSAAQGKFFFMPRRCLVIPVPEETGRFQNHEFHFDHFDLYERHCNSS